MTHNPEVYALSGFGVFICDEKPHREHGLYYVRQLDDNHSSTPICLMQPHYYTIREAIDGINRIRDLLNRF